ncbi:MAG: CoA pyrophosphatase [Alphaproteobacteria bacterium]
MTPQRIIERLARRDAAPVGGAARARFGGDRGRPLHPRGRAPIPAAVLLALVEREEGLGLLLTQRTAHLMDHPGQVSFPGGRVEPEDRDPTHTALRETEEEIGLAREKVEVLGLLDPYHTSTGFTVTPVVGLVRPPFRLTLDSFEVAEAFEVPLEFLMKPANRRRERRVHDGVEYEYDVFVHEGHVIWGATAGMIVGFCDLLSDS